MPILNRSSDSDSDDTDEDGAPPPESEMVRASVTRTITQSYSEHEGVAHYTDGSTETFTFDSFERDDGAIVLSDFCGWDARNGVLRPNPRAFATIPFDNLKRFETTERTRKTIEREATRQVKVSREKAENNDAYTIVSDV